MYIDYRQLNYLLLSVTLATGTRKDIFGFMPLPKIDELFKLLKEAQYSTALDLHSGYYHIKLDEESIPKSGFTTVFEKFEFSRLLFGLLHSPDFFIHLIYNLFGLDKTSNKSQGSGYFAYLNDILIYSKMEQEHLDILHKLLNA